MVARWLNICKVHWREIVALSIAFHFLVDLLIVGPIFFILGMLFGIHLEA